MSSNRSNRFRRGKREREKEDKRKRKRTETARAVDPRKKVEIRRWFEGHERQDGVDCLDIPGGRDAFNHERGRRRRINTDDAIRHTDNDAEDDIGDDDDDVDYDANCDTEYFADIDEKDNYKGRSHQEFANNEQFRIVTSDKRKKGSFPASKQTGEGVGAKEAGRGKGGGEERERKTTAKNSARFCRPIDLPRRMRSNRLLPNHSDSYICCLQHRASRCTRNQDAALVPRQKCPARLRKCRAQGSASTIGRSVMTCPSRCCDLTSALHDTPFVMRHSGRRRWPRVANCVNPETVEDRKPFVRATSCPKSEATNLRGRSKSQLSRSQLAKSKKSSVRSIRCYSLDRDFEAICDVIDGDVDDEIEAIGNVDRTLKANGTERLHAGSDFYVQPMPRCYVKVERYSDSNDNPRSVPGRTKNEGVDVSSCGEYRRDEKTRRDAASFGNRIPDDRRYRRMNTYAWNSTKPSAISHEVRNPSGTSTKIANVSRENGPSNAPRRISRFARPPDWTKCDEPLVYDNRAQRETRSLRKKKTNWWSGSRKSFLEPEKSTCRCYYCCCCGEKFEQDAASTSKIRDGKLRRLLGERMAGWEQGWLDCDCKEEEEEEEEEANDEAECSSCYRRSKKSFEDQIRRWRSENRSKLSGKCGQKEERYLGSVCAPSSTVYSIVSARRQRSQGRSYYGDLDRLVRERNHCAALLDMKDFPLKRSPGREGEEVKKKELEQEEEEAVAGEEEDHRTKYRRKHWVKMEVLESTTSKDIGIDQYRDKARKRITKTRTGEDMPASLMARMSNNNRLDRVEHATSKHPKFACDQLRRSSPAVCQFDPSIYGNLGIDSVADESSPKTLDAVKTLENFCEKVKEAANGPCELKCKKLHRSAVKSKKSQDRIPVSSSPLASPSVPLTSSGPADPRNETKSNLYELWNSQDVNCECSNEKVTSHVRIVKPRRSRGRTSLKSIMIYPPRGTAGPPLTLRKNSSNISCRVKGDARSGFHYDVTYVQKFVSPCWCPKNDVAVGTTTNDDDDKVACDCSSDYG